MSGKAGSLNLLDNDGAFAPYESFKTDAQDQGKFLEGGLARAMEHTDAKKAVKLEALANSKLYSRGVYVWVFKPVSKPVERVLSLGSGRDVDDGRLGVGGSWDDSYDGCAFGVL